MDKWLRKAVLAVCICGLMIWLVIEFSFKNTGNIVTTTVFQAPSPLLTPTEAKGIWDAGNKVLKEGVSKKDADEMKKKLEAAGATVELK